MKVDRKNLAAAGSRTGWVTALLWLLVAVALALMLFEHRAHAWGVGLHAALLGLCLALLYGVIRADSGGGHASGRDRH